jgi:predicted nucleic acid-binding protein
VGLGWVPAVKPQPGLTLDTGALIALERRGKRMRYAIETALVHGLRVTVPVVAVLEWWRAGARQSAILERLTVEPLTLRVAQAAGEAIAAVRATPIDAAVMASAASRGDLVYTSDIEDLQRLQAVFPGVRLLRAS